MSFTYRSYEDLHRLGVQVRDKAVQLALAQADTLVAASNQAPQAGTPVLGPDSIDALCLCIELEYDNLPDLFTRFSVPNPDDCAPMLETLYGSAATLQPSLAVTPKDGTLVTPLQAPSIPGTEPVAQTVDSIAVHMKSWYGKAAGAFEVYVENVKQAAGYQRELAVTLAVILEGQLEIRRRMLTDVWEVGQQTLKALESLGGWCPSWNKVTVGLTVTGALAAVGFAVATEGIGAALGVELVQSLATILTATGSQHSSAAIGGSTVPEIVLSMKAAMDKELQGINAQELDLVACARQTEATVRRDISLARPVPPDFNALSKAKLHVVDNPTSADAFYPR